MFDAGSAKDFPDRSDSARFEALALPHLDAAYNLARWLVRNDDDANDVVQEAFLRAMRSFAGFRGDQPRPWLLAIIRNTAFTWLRKNRPGSLQVPYEPEIHDDADVSDPRESPTPEQEVSRAQDRVLINEALARLPIELREAVVLRELEDLSYREIAAIQSIPVGTVMSRLSRGRDLMRKQLRQRMPGVEDELH